MNWRGRFDNQPFIVKQYEPDAHATDYHLLDMPDEVKHFISKDVIEEIFKDFQEVMGHEWYSREVAVKKLIDKWK